MATIAASGAEHTPEAAQRENPAVPDVFYLLMNDDAPSSECGGWGVIISSARLVVVDDSAGAGDLDSEAIHSAKEYVRRENGVCVTTNGVEGFFANLKRGINGVYHHVGKKHLHRYLSEFDFRYNSRKLTDGQRSLMAVKGANGKRLMLRDSKNCA